MLYFLILIEGYIGLAVQMLFIRQLTPEVGASAVTSSWIIGFFLLALAIGYKKGGSKVQEPIQYLAKNFIKVGVVSSVGVSSVFILLFFDLTSAFSTIASLALYSLLVVSPIAYWMGQSLPLLIQESKWGKNNSEVSGNALYLSTIGSFLGAIITTNIFLFLIGATWTLIVTSALSILIGLYFVNSFSWKVASLSAVFLSLVVNIVFNKVTGMVSSPYADIYIFKEDDARLFVANGALMSKIKDGKSTSWYIKQFNTFINDKKITEKDVLVLGAGGFVVDLNDQLNRYTYVDIDPTLKDVSESRFLMKEIKSNFIIEDARRFLIDQEDEYQVMFLDAFSSSKSIPAHLVTKEFFTLIRESLPVNGYVVVNVVMDSLFRSDYSIRFHSTLVSVFPFCSFESNNSNPDDRFSNVMYYCEKKSEKIEVYTDNSNKNEMDFWKED
jgi:spermidine synthase